MKVFVWQSVGKCSDYWHCGGGVVVFAETQERARNLANSKSGCSIKPDEQPDEVRDVLGGEEFVFIMPDAGCC